MSDSRLAKLEQLRELWLGQISNAEDQFRLEEHRVAMLGKKSELTEILKSLGRATPEEKVQVGQAANALKVAIESALKVRIQEIREERYRSLAVNEFIDMTQPAGQLTGTVPLRSTGSIHPISRMQRTIEEFFTSMGFSVLDGPHVETDFYNFGALNFPDDHPARDMQDTFYLESGNLMRTHTSSVQVRALQTYGAPLRAIVPGRVFRNEELDASHEHTFYQVEGMLVDKQVSVANLLHLMQSLLSHVFTSKIEIRLRPGYFPFVEPGFELDMQCQVCSGSGCSVCKHTGWVEVMPCGLIHPNVLRAAGLNPDEWEGAAFGLGLNRLVMMKYGIEDIRLFQSGNPGFLMQF